MTLENIQDITISTELKRLYFRSVHRGSKEMDIMLGRFAAQNLAQLSPSLIPIYTQLLEEDDANLWDWLVGKNPSPERYHEILALILQCQLPPADSGNQ